MREIERWSKVPIARIALQELHSCSRPARGAAACWAPASAGRPCPFARRDRALSTPRLLDARRWTLHEGRGLCPMPGAVLYVSGLYRRSTFFEVWHSSPKTQVVPTENAPLQAWHGPHFAERPRSTGDWGIWGKWGSRGRASGSERGPGERASEPGGDTRAEGCSTCSRNGRRARNFGGACTAGARMVGTVLVLPLRTPQATASLPRRKWRVCARLRRRSGQQRCAGPLTILPYP